MVAANGAEVSSHDLGLRNLDLRAQRLAKRGHQRVQIDRIGA